MQNNVGLFWFPFRNFFLKSGDLLNPYVHFNFFFNLEAFNYLLRQNNDNRSGYYEITILLSILINKLPWLNEGVDAQDALLKGLTDLKKMTVHAKEVFQTAVDTQQ